MLSEVAGGSPFLTAQPTTPRISGCQSWPQARVPVQTQRLYSCPIEILLRVATRARRRGKYSPPALKKPVPNLSLAIGTGFIQFRTASTGSAPNLFRRTAVLTAPSRYIQTETKIWRRTHDRLPREPATGKFEVRALSRYAASGRDEGPSRYSYFLPALAAKF